MEPKGVSSGPKDGTANENSNTRQIGGKMGNIDRAPAGNNVAQAAAGNSNDIPKSNFVSALEHVDSPPGEFVAINTNMAINRNNNRSKSLPEEIEKKTGDVDQLSAGQESEIESVDLEGMTILVIRKLSKSENNQRTSDPGGENNQKNGNKAKTKKRQQRFK
jgi:hypothetical protein